MTDYHPVTKEELLLLRTHRIANPLEEGHGSRWVPLAWYELDTLVETIASRPDPLALLEAWLHVHPERGVTTFIHKLRTNPDAVEKQGLVEGWWKPRLTL